MIQKKIDGITIQDLEQLIENKVAESRTIEYKLELKIDKELDKKEFLADISSLANSSGGDIIYGIDEDSNGYPIKITGIEIFSEDELKLRIENILRDGLSPRVINIDYQIVKVKNQRFVIIIRVPNSWNSPHRIEYKNSHKFYTRGANGKYLMDIEEIRQSILGSSTYNDKIKEFIEERINNIYTNNTYLPINYDAILVIHLIPVSSFTTGSKIDLREAFKFSGKLRPIDVGSSDFQYNIDGFMTFTSYDNSYTQLFRNGIIEAITSFYTEVADRKVIPSTYIEEKILKSYSIYTSVYDKFGICPPVLVSVTLLGVKDFELAKGAKDFEFRKKHPYKGDILSLPTIMVNDLSENVDGIFKPVFDALWNAYGYSGSGNYDIDGKWNPKN